MKTIKYRAFSKKENRMYYGRSVELWNLGDDLSCRVCLERSNDRHFSEYDVDAIPMQFSGLQDKNGCDIYEGDILQIKSDKLMVVDWSEKFASFVLKREGWAFSHWFGESCEPKDCVIAGNIHQNPELLT